MCRTTPVPLGAAAEGRGSVRPQGLLPHEDEDLHPPGVLDVVEVHGVHPSVGQSGLPARAAASAAPKQLAAFDRWCLLRPFNPEAVGEDAPHEAAVVLVLTVPDGLLLGQGLGQLLPAASRLVGRRGRGHVGQLLRGRGQQIRCRDARDGPVGLGEALNFVLMAAIMVPARADGDAGLTIHGASLRK